ncbi:ribonuclease D [[Haemophilus] ducreyi]|uniref:ribonuclease D n=1 Tax=Haemophilus ducreyi TaxID=730 RepID=UPI0006551BE0|nr:ribonuclease D [[Haemophilus] ducreyi]AKO45658.1 ribonuclease D [[Haemophilus] ducreyi]AKO47044.1 ribonuclease D [[Haemophilus] ducreyi]AKO48388.1 ribonuclease D [[Haemophilus] ducreyi]AKO49775.1 ribonuclease D [[Haemophilus] ducreyi]ANF61385.1 ribonuclease D [[Haemophilus] ducreyi]
MNSRIDYKWIDTNEKLATICQQASDKTTIALDTEFIRTRSYYPKFGLIQLFDGEQTSLIDPTTISDFLPFIDLLANPNIVKVLHACSEDLEIFQHQFNQALTPLIDTQIMAAFSGLGLSIGFAKLVNHYLNIELDKVASRTDWLARPLTETQLQYAAADVYYLLPIYQKLQAELAQTNWQEAVNQECQLLVNKRNKTLELNDAYKEISYAWTLTRQQLAILKLLAKWRIEEARKRDLALNFVIKEQSLIEIAKSQPKHTSQLLTFMHPNEVRIHGTKILWLVEQAKIISEQDYPPLITRLVDQPHYKYNLKIMQKKISEIRPPDLPQELLASKRQLNQLLKWYHKGQSQQYLPELLSGWRAEFGKQILSALIK